MAWTEEQFLDWWYNRFIIDFNISDDSDWSSIEFELNINPIPQDAQDYINNNYNGYISISPIYKSVAGTNKQNRPRWVYKMINETPNQRHHYLKTPTENAEGGTYGWKIKDKIRLDININDIKNGGYYYYYFDYKNKILIEKNIRERKKVRIDEKGNGYSYLSNEFVLLITGVLYLGNDYGDFWNKIPYKAIAGTIHKILLNLNS